MRKILLPSLLAVSLAHLLSCAKAASSAPAAAAPLTASSPASAQAASSLSPMPVDRIDFRIPAVNDPYIKGFWQQPDAQSRWTVTRHVEIRTACNEKSPSELVFTAGAYLIAGKLPKQRVVVKVNGNEVGQFELKQAGMLDYVAKVPAGLWNGNNLIELDFPDAQSPQALGLGNDPRQMGFALQTMTVRKPA